MTRAVVLIPLAGIAMSVAVPLLQHVQKQRDEGMAIETLRAVRAAQERFRPQHGGYATDIASLVTGCASPSALDEETLTRLANSGYALVLRAADDAGMSGRDCHGRALSADYYAAVAPVDASRPAQQAFAARAAGDVFVFYDGIPPNESDIANGLATPLAERSRFKIP